MIWGSWEHQFRSIKKQQTLISQYSPAWAEQEFFQPATDHEAVPVLEQSWQTMKSGFTALSTDSVQRVVPGATHESLVFNSKNARITIKAILQVVEAARPGKRLKR